MTSIFYIKRDRCFGGKFRDNNGIWRTKYIPSAIIDIDEAEAWFTQWAKDNHIPFVKPYTPPRHTAHSQASRVWKRAYSDGCDLSTFIILSQLPCHYCHSDPANNKNGAFVYNGLDRIDSNKDHSTDNIVPCCKQCNFAKRDMSYDAFLTLIRAIHKKHG